MQRFREPDWHDPCNFKTNPNQLLIRPETTTMMQRKSFTKTALLLFVAGAISLAGIQSAAASPDKGAQVPCPNMQQNAQMSADMMKARDAFLKDSKDLRKSMMMKRTEMRAIMQGTNPDPEKVAALAGEIFDLREQLRAKAIANGLPGRGFMGPPGMHPACNMMQGGGPMMMGGGPHHQKGQL